MRTFAVLALLLGLGCTTTPAPPSSIPNPQSSIQGDHGLTVEEEARILALEDRREYNEAVVAQWVQHPNAPHRVRIAMALARIGPHSFLYKSSSHAGLTELAALAADPDRRVREAAAFALGEMGDPRAAATLFNLANDADSGVAAEAVEALSKFGNDDDFLLASFPRYLWMADEKYPEGLRARVTRYLFRFNSLEALAAATNALASPSSAVRQEAAYALSRKAHAPAREQLELLLTDPNTLTRAYATAALGRIGDPASARAIIAALGDAHPWVRTNAAVALGRIAEKDRTILKPEDLPRIFATVDDSDPGVRSAMVDTLAYYAAMNETALARLFAILNNGSQWERELAAGAALKHLDESAYKYIPGSTFTPWQIVRMLEGAAETPFGVNARAQYASNADPMVRAAAIAAIPEGGAHAELDIIRKAMSDADVIVRTNAYDRFGKVVTIPEAARMKELQDAEVRERTSQMNDARLAAISAIAALKDRRRIKYLEQFVEDRDPVVRRVASDLLFEADKIRRPYAPLPVTKTQAEYEQIVRWSRQPHTATIHMPRGVVEIMLLTQDAPMTTWNFAQLAKKGYFNNTSFMRVVPNFVIQGGDPRNDMNGGPGYAIRDEINLQKYTRGAVGMALSGPDTGGSQFFITHSPQPHLDGGYTIFGRVYEGMTGVVDQVERGDRVDRIGIDEHAPVGAEAVAGSQTKE